MPAQDIRYRRAKGVRCKRLFQKVNCAQLDRTYGMGDVSVGRYDDSRRLNALLAHGFEQVQSTHLRHAHVENHEVKIRFGQRAESRSSVRRLDDIKAFSFERNAVVQPHIALVVHNEDALFHEILVWVAGSTK